MLKNDKVRVSPDIKHRYINANKKSLNPNQTEVSNGVWQSNIVSKGDYIIIIPSCRKAMFYGRIIEFRIFNEAWDSFKVIHSKEILINACEFMCVAFDPAYKIRDDGSIEELDMLTKGLKLSHYLCHAIPNLDLDNKNVLDEINKFL